MKLIRLATGLPQSRVCRSCSLRDGKSHRTARTMALENAAALCGARHLSFGKSVFASFALQFCLYFPYCRYRMDKLEPPQVHYVSAAIGWLELGNLTEAKTELQRIEPEYLSYPQVL